MARQPTDPTIFGNAFGPRKIINANGFVTSAWHRGQDYIPPVPGQAVPVYAIADGIVRWTSAGYGPYNSSAGTYVIVEHPGPWRLTDGRVLATVWAGYCHLSRRDVSAGAQLREGARCGLMGTTGASTGVHLHLDIFDRNPFLPGAFENRIDPRLLITESRQEAETEPISKGKPMRAFNLQRSKTQKLATGKRTLLRTTSTGYSLKTTDNGDFLRPGWTMGFAYVLIKAGSSGLSYRLGAVRGTYNQKRTPAWKNSAGLRWISGKIPADGEVRVAFPFRSTLPKGEQIRLFVDAIEGDGQIISTHATGLQW